MGSYISPVMANIYMEFLEQEALETIKMKPDICQKNNFNQWLDSQPYLVVTFEKINTLIFCYGTSHLHFT